MSLRDRIVAEAWAWKGTPYHSNQRLKGVGVDCAQLLIGVFAGVGVIPAVEPEYPPDWHLHREEEKFVGWLERFGERIDEAAALPGDVFLWRVGRCFAHAAIYLGDRQVMHAVNKASVMLGCLDEGELLERKRICWRLRGIDP